MSKLMPTMVVALAAAVLLAGCTSRAAEPLTPAVGVNDDSNAKPGHQATGGAARVPMGTDADAKEHGR